MYIVYFNYEKGDLMGCGPNFETPKLVTRDEEMSEYWVRYDTLTAQHVCFYSVTGSIDNSDDESDGNQMILNMEYGLSCIMEKCNENYNSWKNVMRTITRL